MKFKFPPLCFFLWRGSVGTKTHSTASDERRVKKERQRKRDPPGRGHISKHGGSGDPHPQTRHGANHLKNTGEGGNVKVQYI